MTRGLAPYCRQTCGQQNSIVSLQCDR